MAYGLDKEVSKSLTRVVQITGSTNDRQRVDATANRAPTVSSNNNSDVASLALVTPTPADQQPAAVYLT